MNYLKAIAKAKNLNSTDFNTYESTTEIATLISDLASQMYDKELSPKIYNLWQAIDATSKAILNINNDFIK